VNRARRQVPFPALDAALPRAEERTGLRTADVRGLVVRGLVVRDEADPAVALRVLGFTVRLTLDAVLAIFDALLAEARAALSRPTEAGAARRARRLRRGLGTNALNTAEGSRVLRLRGTTGLSSRGRPALGVRTQR
jgi:hypothetical protein